MKESTLKSPRAQHALQPNYVATQMPVRIATGMTRKEIV